MSSPLAARYQELTKQLQGARLLAVSKRSTVAEILALYELGQRDFGENRVADLVQKAARLPGDICWHFIGPLQKNKIKALLALSSLVAIHSVDSLKTLQRICDAQGPRSRPLGLFFQVNTSEEAQKQGLTAWEELAAMAQYLQDHPHPGLFWQGLMTMAAQEGQGRVSARESFSQLVQWKQAARVHYGAQLELSMGMSQDYLVAVELGSQWVRLGQSLFGCDA